MHLASSSTMLLASNALTIAPVSARTRGSSPRHQCGSGVPFGSMQGCVLGRLGLAFGAPFVIAAIASCAGSASPNPAYEPGPDIVLDADVPDSRCQPNLSCTDGGCDFRSGAAGLCPATDGYRSLGGCRIVIIDGRERVACQYPALKVAGDCSIGRGLGARP